MQNIGVWFGSNMGSIAFFATEIGVINRKQFYSYFMVKYR